MIKFLIKTLLSLGATIAGGVLFRGTIYSTILNKTMNILENRSWLYLLILFFSIWGIISFIRWLLRLIIGNLDDFRYRKSLKRRNNNG